MKNTLLNSKKKEQGFTLAELLIVVAIIGVLVAISIPIFNAQMEKARRAVDLHTARSIESVLVAACNSGEIQFPNKSDDNHTVFVMICRDPSSAPLDYEKKCFNLNKDKSQTCWCGADKEITINGQQSTDWDKYNSQMVSLLTDAGLDPQSLCTRSNGKGDGWDWISIQIGLSKNDKAINARLFSGKAGAHGSSKDNSNKYPTNIEKQIYGIK